MGDPNSRSNSNKIGGREKERKRAVEERERAATDRIQWAIKGPTEDGGGREKKNEIKEQVEKLKDAEQ